MSHVRDPYLHQFALFSETQTRVELDHYKNTYGKDTGKIMTTPRRGHRQGRKKHLNFIPGIVTAFQSGLVKIIVLGFSKRYIIGEGEE